MTISIRLSLADAERLARALRMGGEQHDVLDQLAVSLGASLGLTTASDDTDPLDEGLSVGDSISWSIFVGKDNVPQSDTVICG